MAKGLQNETKQKCKQNGDRRLTEFEPMRRSMMAGLPLILARNDFRLVALVRNGGKPNREKKKLTRHLSDNKSKIRRDDNGIGLADRNIIYFCTPSSQQNICIYISIVIPPSAFVTITTIQCRGEIA